MDRRDITRIILEGLLNGIGFVIGSAVVGMVVSVVLGLTHHPMILIALPIIGVVMWRASADAGSSKFGSSG
jgi:hypothetical protein